MNAEKLKVIAEGMSLEVHHLACEERGGVWVGDYKYPYIYNPLTNNDQCMEIMERLKVDISFFENSLDAHIGGGDFHEGKTIKEAVCNAAYEYFKECQHLPESVKAQAE